jgi:hypothetical protein
LLCITSPRPIGCSFLLTDQFEETFTLCKDEADRAKFFDNILYATNVAGGRTIVFLTMRADFYAMRRLPGAARGG